MTSTATGRSHRGGQKMMSASLFPPGLVCNITNLTMLLVAGSVAYESDSHLGG